MSRRSGSKQFPERREQKSKTKIHTEITHTVSSEYFPPVKPNKAPLQARTENQSLYIESILNNQLVFGIGPAGVGKTFCALTLACIALEKRETEKIYLCRPAQQAGGDFGFLPGTLEEKYEPYLRPCKDILLSRFGSTHLEYLLKRGIIEPRPLEFLRGVTLDNAWVILDEAQNTTPAQMEMFLTRIGDDCKVIINGDLRQSDIKGVSGLSDGMSCISKIDNVDVVQFTLDDIVRGGLCQEIVYAYAARRE